MKYLLLFGVIIGILASYGIAMYQWGVAVEKAEYTAFVISVQLKNNKLTAKLNREADSHANTTRKLIEKESERISAIRAKSNQTQKIKYLENKLRQLESEDDDPDLHYMRILTVDTTVGMYDDARNCGLSASESASLFQGGLSDLTGDDINKTLVSTVGEYCSCSLKYNSLWKECERLLGS